MTFSAATVAEAMQPGIVACPPTTPPPVVAQIMNDNRVHCVAVVASDGSEAEPLVWGVVADLDLVRAAVHGELGATTGELALTPALTVEASTPLPEAVEMMLSGGVQHLVVVGPESARPIGVLSSLDLVATIAPDAG